MCRGLVPQILSSLDPPHRPRVREATPVVVTIVESLIFVALLISVPLIAIWAVVSTIFIIIRTIARIAVSAAALVSSYWVDISVFNLSVNLDYFSDLCWGSGQGGPRNFSGLAYLCLAVRSER